MGECCKQVMFVVVLRENAIYNIVYVFLASLNMGTSWNVELSLAHLYQIHSDIRVQEV